MTSSGILRGEAILQILFENRWQATKVRWLKVGSFVWCAGMLYWAWHLLHAYGMPPGEGGVLQPFGARLRMALMAATIGVLPTAGILYFSSLYLTRVERDRGFVTLTTLGAFAPAVHRYDLSAFTGGSHHEGRDVVVRAPWRSLRVRDRRLPFIVDLQAETKNVDALASLGRPARSLG